MERRAWFSEDRRHRLLLTRRWGSETPALTWVMLNPSTADDDRDDPTMRRVIDYSRRFGYDSCRVVNLFTLITPSPAVLVAAVKAGEKMTDRPLHAAIGLLRGHEEVVAAWGGNLSNRTLAAAAPPVERWAREYDVKLQCLGTTLAGQPLHPARLGKTVQLRPWEPNR